MRSLAWRNFLQEAFDAKHTNDQMGALVVAIDRQLPFEFDFADKGDVNVTVRSGRAPLVQVWFWEDEFWVQDPDRIIDTQFNGSIVTLKFDGSYTGKVVVS